MNKLARWINSEAPLTTIEVGQSAPGFSLKALDGKEYSLTSLLERGPIVLAFFKISCPVCQFTFPFLQRLFERYGGDGVSFLAISQDDALIDEHGYPASNAYGLTNVPTIFLVAPDGSIKVQCMGFSKGDLEKIAAELAQHRALTPAPLFRQNEVVPDYKPG
jgi:thiol-disulfide isomerase/thioredoxin